MFLDSFIATVIGADKDFDADFIREYIVSRVNVCEFDALVAEFEPHASGNEMNGARYAIQVMEEVR